MTERSHMLIDIATVVSELYPDGMAPSLRTVRERMDERGCIVRDGRQCFTTRALIEQYKRLLCEDTARNSAPSNAGTASDGGGRVESACLPTVRRSDDKTTPVVLSHKAAHPPINRHGGSNVPQTAQRSLKLGDESVALTNLALPSKRPVLALDQAPLFAVALATLILHFVRPCPHRRLPYGVHSIAANTRSISASMSSPG